MWEKIFFFTWMPFRKIFSSSSFKRHLKLEIFGIVSVLGVLVVSPLLYDPVKQPIQILFEIAGNSSEFVSLEADRTTRPARSSYWAYCRRTGPALSCGHSCACGQGRSTELKKSNISHCDPAQKLTLLRLAESFWCWNFRYVSWLPFLCSWSRVRRARINKVAILLQRML